MGSRLRENVKHFFECFCEVVPPGDNTEPWIIQQFPEKYKEEEILKSVPKFAYPYKIENDVIQHYSFVLTDLESKWTFGFCRHDPKSQTAIVVLSFLPWHQGFYRFLDTTAVLMHSSRTEDLREFLSAVYNTKIAEPGKKFTVPFNRGESIFTVDVPRPFQLPSIPENRNLTEYFNAVDKHNMMVIFASMLYERRIIFTSKRLKRLSSCVQSANDIIYPMIWQHIFIPVLPMALIDYLLAPMPFLIGVPEEVFKQVRRSEIGDVVILDADANTVETPFDDLNSLPQEVVTSLKKQLKTESLGDGVSRAFLRALVQLIGGYRDALKFQAGQQVTFDEEKFIETRPLSLQPFLREMLHLQIFQQFIEERLMMLNTGQGFSDEFEFELENYTAKSGSKLKQQYKEWTSTMKKEGTAFFKSVKDKANPAMKSAVKTVKDGGKGMKSAYRGLRSKLKDNQQNGALDRPDTKHRSAPSSPTTGKRRTIVSSFGAPVASYRKDAALAFKNSQMQRSYSPLSPTSQPLSPDDNSSRSRSPSIEIPRIDLMNEMEDLLQLRLESPPVDRSLKPVRSLENFKNQSSPSPPERWPFQTQRASAPMTSPSNRFFLQNLGHSQETQNLLQSPVEDVFLSPPVPPRVAPNVQLNSDFGGFAGFNQKGNEFGVLNQRDANLFSAKPFVVAGGHSENGDPLFYVANQNTVDIVKLSPPVCSPSRRKNAQTEDLIRLDSVSSDIDDFDPLKSPSKQNSTDTAPLSLSNPLYTYENHTPRQNGAIPTANLAPNATIPPGVYFQPQNANLLAQNTKNFSYSRHDQDLLQEYGLDFGFASNNRLNNQNSFEEFGNNKVNSQGQWTKFD